MILDFYLFLTFPSSKILHSVHSQNGPKNVLKRSPRDPQAIAIVTVGTCVKVKNIICSVLMSNTIEKEQHHAGKMSC